jgi:translation initiation factor eIF-2B subunit delta
LADTQNEGAPVSQKQKPSKAERRAIQEAQRAAKAAAKEAGNIFSPFSTVVIFLGPWTDEVL